MNTRTGRRGRSFPYAPRRSEGIGWWVSAGFFLLMGMGGLYQAATGDRPLERWGLIGPPTKPIFPPFLAVASLATAGIGIACLLRGARVALQPKLEIVLTPDGIHAPRDEAASGTEFIPYAEIRAVTLLPPAGDPGVMRLDTWKGSFEILRLKLRPGAFEAIHGALLTRTRSLDPTFAAGWPSAPPRRGPARPVVFVNWGIWVVLGLIPLIWWTFLAAVWLCGRNRTVPWDWQTGLLLVVPLFFVAFLWRSTPRNSRWYRLAVMADGLRLTYLAPRYVVRWVPYAEITNVEMVAVRRQVGNGRSVPVETLRAYLRGEEVLTLATGRQAHELYEVIRRAAAVKQRPGRGSNDP